MNCWINSGFESIGPPPNRRNTSPWLNSTACCGASGGGGGTPFITLIGGGGGGGGGRGAAARFEDGGVSVLNPPWRVCSSDAAFCCGVDIGGRCATECTGDCWKMDSNCCWFWFFGGSGIAIAGGGGCSPLRCCCDPLRTLSNGFSPPF